MTTEALTSDLPWPWIYAVAMALTAGSASFLLLQQTADLAWRISHGPRASRRLAPVAAQRLLRVTGLKDYIPLAVALLVAAFITPRSPFLAACFVMLGVVLHRYVNWKRSRTRLAEVSQEMEKLVTVLHSAYLVRPAVAPALEQAAQAIQGPFRDEVDRILRVVWVGGDPKEAYASLGKAPGNPYVAQLGLILERAEECDPALVAETLRELGERLRRRRRLQARVRASTSMLSGTVRFLQGANAIAVAVVLSTPALIDFYLASLARQGLFALALAGVLGASLYFDQQLLSLKERTL